jgi:hypothetical protein
MAYLQLFITAGVREEIQARWLRTPEGEWIAVITLKDCGDFPAVFISIDYNQLKNLIEFLNNLLKQYECCVHALEGKLTPLQSSSFLGTILLSFLDNSNNLKSPK